MFRCTPTSCDVILRINLFSDAGVLCDFVTSSFFVFCVMSIYTLIASFFVVFPSSPDVVISECCGFMLSQCPQIS